MCASVCPSEALWYGTIEEFNDTRRGSLLRDFMFGRQEVRTKVYTVVDDALGGPLDVLAGDQRSWLDDPFGLERSADLMNDDIEPIPGDPPLETRLPLRGGRRRRGHPSRVRPLLGPRHRHDGCRQRRARSVDAAAQHQHR